MDTELKDIIKLEKEFNELSESDSRQFIRFYENNLISIQNIDINKDEEHYNARLRFDCEYGVSLVASGQRKRGADVLEKAIIMFENAPNQDLKKLNSLPYFEQILWNYGLALSETNKINKSYSIFKRLDKHFNNDNKYKNWISSLQLRRVERFSKPLVPLTLIWVALTFTLFQRFESITRFYLAIGLSIVVLTGVSTQIYSMILKRKRTNAQQ